MPVPRRHAGPPLKDSQRKLGRDRVRGRSTLVAAARPAPSPGDQVGYGGKSGTVQRVHGEQVVVDFNGRLWSLPICELEP
jgi:hypothetical protein